MVSTALNFGASSPIDIQIQFTNGKDPRAAQQKAMDLAQQIRDAITGVRGAADVRVQQRLDAPYLVIDVDREKAAAVGLTAQDVILQVVAAMNSSVSINRNFWIDTKAATSTSWRCSIPKAARRTWRTCSTSSPPAPTSPTRSS